MRNPIVLSVAVLFAMQAAGQFDMQHSGTTAALRGIDSVGKGIAWASGTGGTVLRTEDGGYLWQRCNTPPGAEMLDFRGVQAFDENTAIVMSSGKGDLSRIYKTTDGCATWKLVFTNPDKEGFFDSLRAEDETHVWLLGDPVDQRFRIGMLDDGGTTWRFEFSPALQAEPALQGAFAASNSSVFAVRVPRPLTAPFPNPHEAFASGGKGGAFVYRITSYVGCLDEKNDRDRSQEETPQCHDSWKRTEAPVGMKTESSGIFSLLFRNDTVGIAVGGDYQEPAESLHIAAYTHDHGKTWLAARAQPHGYRSSVAYDADSKTWITVGPNGTDVSKDDGQNWRALRPQANDAPDADKDWNALSLPFVVGPRGRIGLLQPDRLKSAATH